MKDLWSHYILSNKDFNLFWNVSLTFTSWVQFFQIYILQHSYTFSDILLALSSFYQFILIRKEGIRYLMAHSPGARPTAMRTQNELSESHCWRYSIVECLL